MAYARLDIYWPDGRIESYLLEAPTVTVGRASDNTIVLDTETVSRHHFSITHTDHSTYLNDLDSENGVVIDGVSLKSYEAHMLEGVAELQVGFLRIVYHPMDESVTVPMRRSAEGDTQPTNANAEFTVRLDVSRVDVWPASSASAEVSITNQLAQPRRFSLKISGMPSEWIRVNRPELEIAPHDTTFALINIKPPRKPDVRPQSYTITVEVIPRDRSEGLLRIALPVRLHGFGGFGMRLAAETIDQGEPLMLLLDNHGSEDLTIALSGRSADGAIQPRFSMPRVTIAAGARAQVRVDALPLRRPWLGAPRTHAITLIAQAHNASRFVAAQEARVTLRPRLSRALLLATLGVFIAAIGLGTLLLGALRGAAAPTLANLRVDAVDLVPGDTFLLSWDGANADVYRVSINQVLVTEVPGDQRSVTLSTAGFTDDLLVAVVAARGEETAREQITVDLTLPLAIAAFAAQPSTLVRNVVTNLMLTWDAPGAQGVSIAGLENFTNAPIAAQLPAQGQLDTVTGLALEPLNLILTAHDSSGNTITQTIRLDVVDATCTSLRAVTLFDGPGDTFQPVSSVQENTPISVVARDQSGQWLRVGLPGDLPVWGARADFICADTFSLNDLRVEIITTPALAATAVPVLVPTATITPLPTPRPTTPTVAPVLG